MTTEDILLAYLASLIEHSLSPKDVQELQELSAFVVDARYSDPYWAAEQATEPEARRWLSTAKHILSALLP